MWAFGVYFTSLWVLRTSQAIRFQRSIPDESTTECKENVRKVQDHTAQRRRTRPLYEPQAQAETGVTTEFYGENSRS